MFRKWWFWLIIGCVLLVVLLVGFIFLAVIFGAGASVDTGYTENTIEGFGNEKILVLSVDGVIGGSSLFDSGFDSQWFIQQLNLARNDGQVKAILIRVNSPGGSVVTSDEIYEKIIQLKEAGKKIVVSMGSIAASGGYYISAPADYIFANRATLTGSLGVIFTLPNYQGAAEWIGYKETNIQSGQFKDMGNPLREMTDAEKKIYQTLIDESYERFVDIIAEGRNLSREDTVQLADGRVYSGNQALRLGLIDELGSYEDAVAYTKQLIGANNARVIEYSQPMSWSKALLGFQAKQNEPLERVITQLVPSSNLEPGLMYLYKP